MTENKNTDEQENKYAVEFNFDRNFQEKIVKAMILDKVWAGQFSEVLKIDYFGFADLKLVSTSYLDYFSEYKEFPSQELLLNILRDKLKDSDNLALRESVKKVMIQVLENKDLGDLPYVKDASLSWCKKMAMVQALDKSITLAENEDDHEKIIDLMQKAISAGNSHTKGLYLFDDIDARYSETYRTTIATGIPELDRREVLNGGLGEGELGIVVAPSGVGKSHYLVQMGAAALLQGKNVVHYSFELNERLMGIRYDSNLLDISSSDCFMHKDKIKNFYKDNTDKLGSLLIKYYPTSTASVVTLKNHLQKMASNGFRPDLIIIDYAGIMRSTSKYELLRLELKKICEELRSFADEQGVPLWTALQSNRDGADKDIIDLTNMAESYAQAAVADFVVGISRKSTVKSKGIGTMFIAKNRAGMDGIQYRIYLDTSKSKLKVISETDFAEISNMIDSEANENAMNLVRTKFRQLQTKNQ